MFNATCHVAAPSATLGLFAK